MGPLPDSVVRLDRGQKLYVLSILLAISTAPIAVLAFYGGPPIVAPILVLVSAFTAMLFTRIGGHLAVGHEMRCTG